MLTSLEMATTSVSRGRVAVALLSSTNEHRVRRYVLNSSQRRVLVPPVLPYGANMFGTGHFQHQTLNFRFCMKGRDACCTAAPKYRGALADSPHASLFRIHMRCLCVALLCNAARGNLGGRAVRHGLHGERCWLLARTGRMAVWAGFISLVFLLASPLRCVCGIAAGDLPLNLIIIVVVSL